MPSYKNPTLQDIDSFAAGCSQKTGDDYEPYINYDIEPDVVSAKIQPSLLKGSGMELYEDQNTLSFYIISSRNELTGYCSSFSYFDNDGARIHELSVIIAPEYRYHGLGRMLVMQMLSSIEKDLTSDKNAETDCDNIAPHILLVGSNEAFAVSCGFCYSHSEHFMTREPFAELDIDAALCPPHVDIDTCKSNPGQYPVAVSRNSHNTEGHYTYLLLCNGARASRCSIFECSDYVNIANVYTNKKYRGRRLAGQLINAVASDFPQKKLLLQVAGSNTAALHAYTKAGFSFFKTFDYYIATP